MTSTTPQPINVTIAGQSYSLSYPMRAVIQYQQETARIERRRPRPADADPRCICGFRKSSHVGPNLIRLDDQQALLCPRFRAEDPLLGDSLFLFEAWTKIDLNLDPERWLVCLWCGLHRKVDGEWRPPFTLDELAEKVQLEPQTREISNLMFDALAAWMPKKQKDDVPNVAAPVAPAPPNLPTSTDSASDSETDTDSRPTNSSPPLPTK